MNRDMDVITIIIAFFLGALVVSAYFYQQSYKNQKPLADKQEIIVVNNQPEPEVLPYWAVQGTPSYWPYYLSPYWYFGAPYSGPITGGQYPGHKTRPDSRGIYAPHGPRPGYSGVSVGGGGGGHGGGGH